jgi:hypothetical protein
MGRSCHKAATSCLSSVNRRQSAGLGIKKPPDLSEGSLCIYSVVGNRTGSCALAKLLSAIRRHGRSRIGSHRRIRSHCRRRIRHRGGFGRRLRSFCFFRTSCRQGDHGHEKEGGFRDCFHSFECFCLSEINGTMSTLILGREKGNPTNFKFFLGYVQKVFGIK